MLIDQGLHFIVPHLNNNPTKPAILNGSYIGLGWVINFLSDFAFTVIILSFRTNTPGQTVQTQIRLLLEGQFDKGLHCLQFILHFH